VFAEGLFDPAVAAALLERRASRLSSATKRGIPASPTTRPWISSTPTRNPRPTECWGSRPGRTPTSGCAGV